MDHLRISIGGYPSDRGERDINIAVGCNPADEGSQRLLAGGLLARISVGTLNKNGEDPPGDALICLARSKWSHVVSDQSTPIRHRILIVEDETLVAILVEDMLNEMGFDSAGVASRLDEGLSNAQTAAFDAALLDVNLGGNVFSFPIAERLRERGIPFVFATGYAQPEIAIKFPGVPVIQKPFSEEALQKALHQILPTGGVDRG